MNRFLGILKAVLPVLFDFISALLEALVKDSE